MASKNNIQYNFIFSDNQEILTDIPEKSLNSMFNSTNKNEEYKDIRDAFTISKNDINLYILIDDEVVGFIMANVKKPDIIDIDVLNIKSIKRKKGLCTKMLSLFIKLTEDKYGEKIYRLENVGGVGACNCYKKSFEHMGYDVTIKSSTNRSFSKIDKCDDRHLSMKFKKIH